MYIICAENFEAMLIYRFNLNSYFESKHLIINIMEKDINDEVKNADKILNLDAPFADVDPEAADMPDSVVNDL